MIDDDIYCYNYSAFIITMFIIYTGKCLKPEQFLKAEHLLKHAFPYRDRSFYGPDR